MKPEYATDFDEIAAISAVREGDHRAFAILYRKYRPLLMGFLRSLNLERDAREEIVQSTFHSLWESRSRLLSDRPLQAFLFQIAKNRIYNEVRKNALRERYLAALAQEQGLTDQGEARELEELLLETVEKLSPKRKAAFQLSRFEGFSNQEIAIHLGLSKSTVENHINAALKELRRRLAGSGY